jgi:hypothetical protein
VSRGLLREPIEDLPYALRENVLDYASFVEAVAPDRAADMDLELDRDQRDRVVFFAGLLHLREVVAGQLALVEVAAQGHVNRDVRGLRIGNEDLRPGSPYVRRMRQLRGELDDLLLSAGLSPSAGRLSDAIELVVIAES